MLQLYPTALQEMIDDATKTFPDECCGFLFGNDTGDLRVVDAIQVVDNGKEGDKKRRFVISPRDYLKAEHFAETNNLQLLGVYHSHPNHPAFPSEHDRVAAQPFFSYIILSIINNEFDAIRSWRLNGDNFFEEETITTPQTVNSK